MLQDPTIDGLAITTGQAGAYDDVVAKARELQAERFAVHGAVLLRTNAEVEGELLDQIASEHPGVETLVRWLGLTGHVPAMDVVAFKAHFGRIHAPTVAAMALAAGEHDARVVQEIGRRQGVRQHIGRGGADVRKELAGLAAAGMREHDANEQVELIHFSIVHRPTSPVGA